MSEWWLDPSKAGARLGRLTDQWTALSNAAIGRGLVPTVRPALAAYVGRRVADYRAWRAGIGGLTNVQAWHSDLEAWENEAATVREQILADGHAAPAPLPEHSGLDLSGLLSGPSFAAAMFGLGVVWLLTRRQ